MSSTTGLQARKRQLVFPDLATFDLTALPQSEDDEYEFKSSKTAIDDLKGKLSRAVSGFANSGGGYFIAGVEPNGNADGGFPRKVGRQDLRDWADNIIHHHVEPVPAYDIKLLDDLTGHGGKRETGP